MNLIIAYAVALVSLAVLDFVWLSLIKGFVASQIGHLFGAGINWTAVVLFYLLYAAAVVYFARSSSWQEALMRGALLGFTAYMTYDLTNLATLNGWPIKFVLVDVAWGTIMTALTAAIVSLI